MASTLKVNTIAHTGGITGLTIDNSGKVALPQQFSPNGNLLEQWRFNKGDENAMANDTVMLAWARDTRAGIAQRNVGIVSDTSTGVFTFPRTGLFKVTFTGRYYGATSYMGGALEMAVDGSVFNTINQTFNQSEQTNHHFSTTFSTIVDITNVTTHKIRFKIFTSSSVNVRGANDVNACTLLFEELGAT